MPIEEDAGATIDRTRKAILKIQFKRGGGQSRRAPVRLEAEFLKSAAKTKLVQYWLAASWPLLSEEMLVPVATPPKDLLEIASISIHSPGFWEVLGGLNPLQQIREYLNDRHKRRQDREFREAAEKKKLEIENELAPGRCMGKRKRGNE